MLRLDLSGKSILTALLCLLVVWAPLPFASITPLGRAAIEIAAFVLIIIAIFSIGRIKDLRPIAPAVLSAAAIGVLALATSLHWPVWLVRLVSPAHVALAEEAAVAGGWEVPSWVVPSLAPEISRHTGVTWLAVVALVLAAAIAGRRRRRRRWLVAALLGSAFIQGLLGLRARLSGIATIWGQAETADASRLRGTFVNQNHAAFFFMVAAAMAFGLTWWAWRRASREASPELRVVLRTLPAALWLALLVALTLTGSRAGFTAALVAMVVQISIVAHRKRQWWLLPAGIGATLATSGLAAMMSGYSGLERVVGTSVAGVTQGYRLEAWRACLELWRRFPFLGTGSGSFREAFPMVQPQMLIRESWYHAHNDLLELLVTGGLLTSAVLVMGLAAVGVRLARAFRHAHRTEDEAFVVAAIGIAVGAMVHEFFDFGLTTPANWVVVSVVLGAALGIWIRPDSHRRGEPGRASASG